MCARFTSTLDEGLQQLAGMGQRHPAAGAEQGSPPSVQPSSGNAAPFPHRGFYEWKTEGLEQQPFCIHRATGIFFAFAVLMQDWQGPQVLDALTISTFAPTSRI